MLQDFLYFFLNLWFKKKSAEGCFTIDISKDPTYKTGWKIKATFHVGFLFFFWIFNSKKKTHQKDLALLKLIKNYYLGYITKQDKNCIRYRVYSLKDLTIIIDHFIKYPLLTQKLTYFELFKKVVIMMANNEHLTLEGLNKIIALKYFLNKGLSDKLKQAFSDVPFVLVKSRPLVQPPKIFNPYWIAGFTSGDGCFYISIYKSSTKLGEAVRLMFTIIQDSRDELLMKNLVNYLGWSLSC